MVRRQKRQLTQADKLADLARELECDEDEAAFEETAEKAAKSPLLKLVDQT